MNKQIQIVVIAVVALMLGGGGFVAGMTLGPELGNKTEASAQSGGAARQQGAGARAGGAGAQGQGQGQGAFAGGAGGAAQAGRVISVNDGSITVEVRTPGSDAPRSVIVLVGNSARIVKTTETDIKLGDIKPGDTVLVAGQADAATGTISATAVIDGFTGFGAAGGGQGGARPSGSGAPRPSANGSPRP